MYRPCVRDCVTLLRCCSCWRTPVLCCRRPRLHAIVRSLLRLSKLLQRRGSMTSSCCWSAGGTPPCVVMGCLSPLCWRRSWVIASVLSTPRCMCLRFCPVDAPPWTGCTCSMVNRSIRPPSHATAALVSAPVVWMPGWRKRVAAPLQLLLCCACKGSSSTALLLKGRANPALMARTVSQHW